MKLDNSIKTAHTLTLLENATTYRSSIYKVKQLTTKLFE